MAVLVQGPRGSGRRALAAAIAGHLGKPLLASDLRELFALEGKARGTLLRAITDAGHAAWDDDPEAAASLVADGLASRGGPDDELLLPPART